MAVDVSGIVNMLATQPGQNIANLGAQLQQAQADVAKAKQQEFENKITQHKQDIEDALAEQKMTLNDLELASKRSGLIAQVSQGILEAKDPMIKQQILQNSAPLLIKSGVTPEQIQAGADNLNNDQFWTGLQARGISADEYWKTLQAAKASAAKEGKIKWDIKELKETDPTTGQDIYNNVITANGYPVATYSKGERKPSGTKIQNIVGNNDFYASLGKELGKDFIAKRQNAEGAVKSLESSNNAIDLLNRGAITGTGAEFILGVGKALKQAGLYSGEALSNTEAFYAEQAKQVAQIIKAFGAGTGLSNADRVYAEKAAAGKITMTEESLRKIIDLNNEASKNAIKTYNKEAESVDKTEKFPFKLTVEMPKVEQAIQTKVDTTKATNKAQDNTGKVWYEIGGEWVDENGNKYQEGQ